ncbi:uncharacterized protein YgiM (DUF1202 family) [Bacillus ectoiniformans]|uniref:SH3 domain-containing protein n=1 Tax=Bacillus ectoiniformans TaxID=1494429 RepID=UPI0019566C77|nr:SH3 domain-containing protein [Bacillus ectoiniformans]MBM7647438.1 uncharacterized protein YgiM (DUF1202 family) [Bacillus ectoiniformans]
MFKRKALVTVLLLFALWHPASSITSAASSLPKATVNASSLIVREYPSPKAKALGQVMRNQLVYIHSTQPGGWAEIRLDGKRGYVPAGFLKLMAPASDSKTIQKATVQSSTLLIRKYPSPKSVSVGSFKRGAVTYIHAVKPGGWAEIRHNGQPAYVPAAYLKVVPAVMPSYKPGQYIVGKQIQPGLYYSSGGVDYWERQSSLSGSLEDILANDIPSGPAYVEVKSTDKAFMFEGGSFQKFDQRNHNHTLKSTFKDGTYLIGVDIRPGFYRGVGDGYWERSTAVTGEIEDIIVNDVPSGTFYVEIKADDFAFKTHGITWTKIK